jgi:ATP-dependent DNA helicase DinG
MRIERIRMDWSDDYCILEIVTTGPDPENALPVEAAAIRIRNGSESDSISVLVDTGFPVPASLRERSGRAEEDYHRGLSPPEALSRVRDFCGRSHVLAHEGTSLEAAVLERFGGLPAGPILDTRQVAWLAAPYMRDHSIAGLAASLLGEKLTWRALEDARLLHRILDHLQRSWGEAPRATREAVIGALTEADSPWRFLLSGRPGRKAFPDLVESIPRVEEARRGEDGARIPTAGASGARCSVDADEVAAFLSHAGALASIYPEHESRPQQAAMAKAVASAFNEGAFLVVEAGTGVGKSLAYLVPGVMHARAGGGPLVVSTYTRNLQEQLFHRDLPLLSRALGAVEFSLLKGRRNYLCLRKWAEWCAFLSRGEPVLHFSALTPGECYAFLVSWLTHTSSGDLEEISLDLRALLAESATELASSVDDCLKPHCIFGNRCWVERARAQAARSEVVVVNHALLLSQIGAAEQEPADLILPEYHTLVIDEAHHLEDVATDAFSMSFSLQDCLRTLDEIEGRRGLLAGWSRLDLDTACQEMLSGAYEAAGNARLRAEELHDSGIEPLLPPEGGRGADEIYRQRLETSILNDPIWEGVRERGMGLAAVLSRLAVLLASLVEKTHAAGEETDREGPRERARKGEILAGRLGEAAAALEVFLLDPLDSDYRRHLRWIESAPVRSAGLSPASFRLNSAPVNVREELFSLLLSRLDSAAFTSASLRVPGGKEGFAFFLDRAGLDLFEEAGGEVRLMALDSPFDYSCQVRLMAVTDLPDPSTARKGSRRYIEQIGEVVEEILVATGGKALVLLTSHQQVEFLFAELRPRLESRGICCLRQRRGMPNALLLERFREDRDSVLLATEAFWEGVDVPGDSLSAVIMVKLPFRHPEDPVVAGRMEHHDLNGGGGWGSYYLPLAVTLFRQGVGRLIRRSTDQGIIVVLDPRFVTRSYSRYFHAALPEGLRVERMRRDELGDAVRSCF